MVLRNTPRCFRGIYGSITPISLLTQSNGTLRAFTFSALIYSAAFGGSSNLILFALIYFVIYRLQISRSASSLFNVAGILPLLDFTLRLDFSIAVTASGVLDFSIALEHHIQIFVCAEFKSEFSHL